MNTKPSPIRILIAPIGFKWEPKSYYSIKVKLTPTNIKHYAILYTGFLDDQGNPGNYSCIWAGIYDTPIRVSTSDIYMVDVQNKLDAKDGFVT